MESPSRRPDLAANLRQGFLAAVVLAMLLVLYARVVAPGASLLGTAAALLVLLGYAALAWAAIPAAERLDSRILRLAWIFGLLAGLVFTLEILYEYIFLPSNNTPAGLVEFGGALALYFLASAVQAYRSGRVGPAVLTALGSAQISALLWLVVLLIIFYAFHGSARQILVMRAEGNYADFARSGAADFNTFVIEDLMGASFYHLLLGPLAAAVLGALGGLAGKAVRRLFLKSPQGG